MGNGGLKNDQKIRYSSYNAYGVVSRFGWHSRCRKKLRVTLTVCGLKPYGRATEAVVRLYRGNFWLSGKMKSNIGCMEGGLYPGFVCQGKPSNFG